MIWIFRSVTAKFSIEGLPELAESRIAKDEEIAVTRQIEGIDPDS